MKYAIMPKMFEVMPPFRHAKAVVLKVFKASAKPLTMFRLALGCVACMQIQRPGRPEVLFQYP
jgi:hypothetical protein